MDPWPGLIHEKMDTSPKSPEPQPIHSVLTPTPGPCPWKNGPWDLVLPTLSLVLLTSTNAKTHRAPAHQQADTTSKMPCAPQPAMSGSDPSHQLVKTSYGTHLCCHPETRFYPPQNTHTHTHTHTHVPPHPSTLWPGPTYQRAGSRTGIPLTLQPITLGSRPTHQWLASSTQNRAWQSVIQTRSPPFL